MPFMRKYGTLLVTGTTSIRIPIIKRAVVDYAVGADWTPAAGDVKIFVDAAAVANITNLPTAIAAGNTAFWEFIITAAELSCKQLLVTISDAATKVIEDQAFIVETFGNASAMYAADLSLANLPANVTQLLGTAWLTPGVAGTPDVNAKLIGGTAQTGVDIGADTNDIQTRLPTALVGGRMDASVGAMAADVVTAAAVATDAIDADALAADAVNEIADGLLNRDMAVGADTIARSPRNALRFLRNKRGTAVGVLTVTKEDDIAAAWTATLTTDAAAVPVITVDPA